MIRRKILSRLALLAVCAVPVPAAIDNATRFTPSATQANRPFTDFKWFQPGEICDYPRPRVNGSILSQWQVNVHSRWPASMSYPCPATSIKAAYISFHHGVTANVPLVIEYVNDLNPCHLGNQATCDAAALTQSQMLSTVWNFYVDAEPDQTADAATLRVSSSARLMVQNGHWRYRLRGPILTQIIAEDNTPARTYDFGFTRRHYAFHTNNVSSTGTYFAANAVHWQNIPRPFLVQIRNEVISICYVSPAGELYVGTTNGTNSSCASAAGRGQDGTTAATQNSASGVFLTLYEGLRSTTTMWGGTKSVAVNDASSVNDVTIFQMGAGNRFRVCNKSGNTLIIGNGAWGCTASTLGTHIDGYSFTTTGGPLIRVTEDGSNNTSQWVAAINDSHKPIHPIFVLSFYPSYGLSNVGAEAILVNGWLDRVQDQDVDLYFVTHAGQIATRLNARLTGNTIWKFPDGPVVWRYENQYSDRKFWAGTPPAGGLWDKNRAHLRAARVFPHDPNIPATQSSVDYALSPTIGWDGGNTQCEIERRNFFNEAPTSRRDYIGHFIRDFSQPGGRPDIGIIPGWQLIGLQAMGTNLTGANRWMEWTLGLEACAGYFPSALLDSATNKLYCDSGSATVPSCENATNKTASSFGRMMSIDAYPDLTSGNSLDLTSYIIRAPVTTRRMLAEFGHWPGTGWVGFALTGDYYYQLALWAHAWQTLYATNNGPNQIVSNTRSEYLRKRIGQFGIQGPMNGVRSTAWGVRTLGYAWLASPDGSPEQEYHRAKILNNIAFWEGKWRITNGARYTPCPDTEAFSKWSSSPWCAGFRVSTDTSGFWANFEARTSATNDGNVDPTYNAYPVPGWQEDYAKVVVGYLYQAGFVEMEKVVKALAPTHTMFATASPWPFGTIEPYRRPYIPCLPVENAPFIPNCSGQNFDLDFNFTGNWQMPNWQHYLLGVGATAKSRVQSTNASDVVGGYFSIWLGALAMLDQDHLVYGSAERVMDWARWGGEYSKARTDPRQWHFSRVRETLVPIYVNPRIPSLDNATVSITAPDGGPCSYRVGTAYGFHSSVEDDLPAPGSGSRERILVLSGLNPGPNYLRVTCGNARSAVRWVQ